MNNKTTIFVVSYLINAMCECECDECMFCFHKWMDSRARGYVIVIVMCTYYARDSRI